MDRPLGNVAVTLRPAPSCPEELRLEPQSLLLQIDSGPALLNGLVQHLLGSENPLDLVFLVNGQSRLLSSLSNVLCELGVSGESSLQIEYAPAAPGPLLRDESRLPDWVRSLCHLRDGGLAVGCFDRLLRILPPADAERPVLATKPLAIANCIGRPPEPGSPGPGPGQLVVCGCSDNSLRFVDSHPGLSPSPLWAIQTDSAVQQIAFLPSRGELVFSSHWNGTLAAHSCQRPARKAKAAGPLLSHAGLHSDCVSFLASTPSERLFSAGYDRRVHLIDPASLQAEASGTLPASVTCGTAVDTGAVALGHATGAISLVDWTLARTVHQIRWHRSWVSAAVDCSDAVGRFASADHSGNLALWDMRNTRQPVWSACLGDQTTGGKKILCLAYSQAQRELAVGGEECIVKRFSI